MVTNDHVIGDCRDVRAAFPVDEYRQARVLARDPQNDLALLRLPTGGPVSAPFREGRGIRPGDSVVVIGFPLRGMLTSGVSVTTGTISALAGPGDDVRLLQVTAPIQAGNSGGPVLDQSGNVVGVVVGKLDALMVAQKIGDLPQNVNFAIHAAVVRAFLDANAVNYEIGTSGRQLSAADIGARARTFTLAVECRQ